MLVCLMLLDPRSVHSHTSLRTDTGAKIIILVSDPAHHARAPAVPWPQRQTIEVGHRSVKVDLRREIDERAR